MSACSIPICGMASGELSILATSTGRARSAAPAVSSRLSCTPVSAEVGPTAIVVVVVVVVVTTAASVFAGAADSAFLPQPLRPKPATPDPISTTASMQAPRTSLLFGRLCCEARVAERFTAGVPWPESSALLMLLLLLLLLLVSSDMVCRFQVGSFTVLEALRFDRSVAASMCQQGVNSLGLKLQRPGQST
ncbi:unannotated protein [freshwater metagenome]|uniref:Unannotated protein n=1 Tax=freshwater metagenome TaxID=449393 RepID=A0A6J7NFA4_9ZZZZ